MHTNTMTNTNKDVAIKVEGLYKKFTANIKRSMAYGTIDVFRNFVGMPSNHNILRKSEFWALQDINFEVKHGEKLGFLGENGSGKSTLLRLINGIFPPDKGRITVRGSIGALIAVGAGFHPHMTGRENIYLNGTILGMRRKEIKGKFDEIIAFAEIGDFIDAPVSTYSSGMRVRLGFSIAIHIEPEIMLVDEVLSVGDLSFQLKCLKKLSEYREKGGTFIIVSHNMQTIRNSCDRVIWLDKGKIIDEGDTHDICNKYESAQIEKTYSSEDTNADPKVINLDPLVKITSVKIVDSTSTERSSFQAGERITVAIDYQTDRVVNEPIFTVAIADREGNIISENYSNFAEGWVETGPKSISGSGRVTYTIDRLALKPNVYDISVMLSEKEQLNKLEWHERAYSVAITNEKYPINQGLIYPHPVWSYDKN